MGAQTAKAQQRAHPPNTGNWETLMRCYFMHNGHIRDVEVIDAATDAETIQLAIGIFYKRLESVTGESYDGFELWDDSRFVHKHMREVHAA